VVSIIVMIVCLCVTYKDVNLENYIAVPDDSCSVTASLDAAVSVVPPTHGLRPKPFDEACFDVTSLCVTSHSSVY